MKKGFTKYCWQCRKPFYLPKSLAFRNYCSRKCRYASAYILRLCGYCRTSFTQRKGERPKRYCSLICQKSGTSGPLSKLWRGNRKHYRGHDWKERSEEARVRDQNICQVCGKEASELEKLSVDHIVPFRMCTSNDLINLLSVCRAPCHTRKTSSEPKLLRGDYLGYVQDLRTQGWPIEKVERAISWWNKQPQLSLVFRPQREKTHCKNGHPYENNGATYKRANGKTRRLCLLCRKLAYAQNYARTSKPKSFCVNGHALVKGKNGCRACLTAAHNQWYEKFIFDAVKKVYNVLKNPGSSQSMVKLAELSGVSTHTVSAVINKFEELGRLQVTRRVGRKGNLYALL